MINYSTEAEGMQTTVSRLKINYEHPELSGFDYHYLYEKLPNGDPAPKDYKRPQPYHSLA